MDPWTGLILAKFATQAAIVKGGRCTPRHGQCGIFARLLMMDSSV